MTTRVSWSDLRLPLSLFLLSFIAILTSVIRLVVLATTPLADIGDLEPLDQRYVQNAAGMWLHVFPGLTFLLIGLVQFMPIIRRRVPRLHRWMGRIFIVCGLISGLSIYWLSFSLPAMGGTLAIVGTWVFTTGMMASLIIAWRAIRRRNIPRHRAFMIRAYAIGSAVATIRIVGILGEVAFGFDFPTNFGVWIWVGMLINVIGAELILARGRRPTPWAAA